MESLKGLVIEGSKVITKKINKNVGESSEERRGKEKFSAKLWVFEPPPAPSLTLKRWIFFSFFGVWEAMWARIIVLYKNEYGSSKHFLIHCRNSRSLWVSLFSTLGVTWTFPNTIKKSYWVGTGVVCEKEGGNLGELLLYAFFWSYLVRTELHNFWMGGPFSSIV